MSVGSAGSSSSTIESSLPSARGSCARAACTSPSTSDVIAIDAVATSGRRNAQDQRVTLPAAAA